MHLKKDLLKNILNGQSPGSWTSEYAHGNPLILKK
jgi:hypothetical protein